MGLTSNKGKAVDTEMQNNTRVIAFQNKLKEQTQTRLNLCFRLG